MGTTVTRWLSLCILFSVPYVCVCVCSPCENSERNRGNSHWLSHHPDHVVACALIRSPTRLTGHCSAAVHVDDCGLPLAVAQSGRFCPRPTCYGDVLEKALLLRRTGSSPRASRRGQRHFYTHTSRTPPPHHCNEPPHALPILYVQAAGAGQKWQGVARLVARAPNMTRNRTAVARSVWRNWSETQTTRRAPLPTILSEDQDVSSVPRGPSHAYARCPGMRAAL